MAASRAANEPATPAFDPPSRPADWPAALARCRNDFEPVVAARHPEIAETVRALREGGAIHAMMSGSGSAVFGLFDEAGTASDVLARYADRDGWRTWLTRTLP